MDAQRKNTPTKLLVKMTGFSFISGFPISKIVTAHNLDKRKLSEFRARWTIVENRLKNDAESFNDLGLVF